MKKCVIFLLLVTAFSVLCHGKGKSNNTLYYELGGTGAGYFSLNYERQFKINKIMIFSPGLGFSLSNDISVGGSREIGDTQFYIPYQLNFLFGPRKHFFEVGFGMPLAIDEDKFRFIGSIYILRFGYRYQPQKSGFLFRASINPRWIAIVPGISAGLSVGYKF